MIRLVFAALLISAPAVADPYGKDLTALSKERVIFHTNVGDIAVAFYPNAAPQHVTQVLALAKAGVYEDTPIFRIDHGFVAQISSYERRLKPITDEQRKLIKKIPAEFTSIQHRRGLLSMARYEDVNSAESSFSFMLGDAKHLDGRYTIFGEVVRGLDVLAAIENTPTDNKARPLIDITVNSASVMSDEELAKTKLAEVQKATDPDEPYQNFFKIFAALAFGITVPLPIARTLWASRNQKS